MKLLIVATFGSGALAVLLASQGLSVSMNMAQARARFPGSRPVGEAHVGLLTIHKGHVSEIGTYSTRADLTSVWRWYDQHFEVELPVDDTINEREGCLTVLATQAWAIIRRVIQATLCSQSFGTSIFIYQTVYVWR